ncbi:non-hydrolyzing UDP-N-acetylglucosamine 2-epimerase [Salinisphaera sp.]|uniref:non-hydrolyzing UDP-N-acetylglucosamine 2-epimerase n=1 Tax=Salinisphaera sp. TaxID=1914330 RepID=UPI0032C23E67
MAARPNFMKAAPIHRVLSHASWCDLRLVHTGQHYDQNMSGAFLADLGIPAPDLHLGIGGGSHAEQTGRTLMAYEKACIDERPDWTVVVGDVNATLACSLAATKLGICVGHVEAGLRSRDREMPEEINRIVTDAIADLLWTPSADANENLRAEGIPEARVDFVGNVMIDTFEFMRARIEGANARELLGLAVGGYAVVTLHRPSNVDDPTRLSALVDTLVRLSTDLPLVFPIHPRTRARLERAELLERLDRCAGVHVIEPQGYVNFMNLLTGAAIAITDSGGMQEETTYLGIPCLTVRDTTERPITLTQGTNQLVRTEQLADAAHSALASTSAGEKRHVAPPLWDGRAAERIVASLRQHS